MAVINAVGYLPGRFLCISNLVNSHFYPRLIYYPINRMEPHNCLYLGLALIANVNTMELIYTDNPTCLRGINYSRKKYCRTGHINLVFNISSVPQEPQL